MTDAVHPPAPSSLGTPPRFVDRLVRMVSARPGLSGTQIQREARVAPAAVFDAIGYAAAAGLVERRPVTYENAAGAARVRDGLFPVVGSRTGQPGRRRRGPDPEIVAARNQRLAELCLPAILGRIEVEPGLSAWQLSRDPALAEYGEDVKKAIALALERGLIHAAPTFYRTGKQGRTRTGLYLGAQPSTTRVEELSGPDLKKKMADVGINQYRLAELANVSQTTVWAWEQRGVPPARVAEVRQALDTIPRLHTPEEEAAALVDAVVKAATSEPGLSRETVVSRVRAANQTPPGGGRSSCSGPCPPGRARP